MKKIYLTAGLVLASLCAFAQPQLTQSSIPVNFSADFYYAEVENFNPGPSGANQTWDFSNITAVVAGESTFMPSAGTPYASSYPLANHAIHYGGLGQSLWYYNRITAQKLEHISLVYAGVIAINYSANPKTMVEFPYAFNSVFTDTYREGPEDDDTAFTATYDAYGTLILPFGTYHNVIRQKVVEDGKTEYNWYNSDPFYPLLQTNLEDGSIGLMKGGALGVGDNQQHEFLAYPNPFTDVVTINIPQQVSGRLDISITDMLGKLVHATAIDNAIGGTSASLDLNACTTGVYLLSITDSNGNTQTRKLIRR